MSGSNQSQHGVAFALDGGRRSSQAAGKAIVADAVRSIDGALARRIDGCDWRKDYIRHIRDVVRAGTRSPKDALRIAADGLAAIQGRVVFADGQDGASLKDALSSPGGTRFGTAVVHGRQPRETALRIPYQGALLQGDALLAQLDRWVAHGIIEPSCAGSLSEMARNKDWLDLSDRHFVLLGAASEMGPLPALCRWGANVVAVDLPDRRLWGSILAAVRKGSGRMHALVRTPVDDEDAVAAAAGADLLTEAPQVLSWLRELTMPFTVGNYVYADGSRFLLLSAIADALLEALTNDRPDVSPAYLATPTDAFAVPADIVHAARDARERRGRLLPAVVRRATAGRLYVPHYREMIEAEDGRHWGIADSLIPQQGANYAVAKQIQRWRAMTARHDGRTASANVAPATRTRSVTRNRILAAAYAGAPRFGVEIFEPETSSALMAALLVRDIRSGGDGPPEAHPFQTFVDAAAHGGLWRLPFEPRSVLPLAVVSGVLARHA